MVLFEVPGWDTPKDGPSITPAKKRKRPSADGSNSKLIAAEVNLEKLIEKLDAGKKGTHGISRKGKKRKSDSSADHVVDGPHKSNKAKMKGVDDHKSAAVSHSVHATVSCHFRLLINLSFLKPVYSHRIQTGERSGKASIQLPTNPLTELMTYQTMHSPRACRRKRAHRHN